MRYQQPKPPGNQGARSTSVPAQPVVRLAVVLPDLDRRKTRKAQRDIRRRLESLGFRVTPLGVALPFHGEGGAA